MPAISCAKSRKILTLGPCSNLQRNAWWTCCMLKDWSTLCSLRNEFMTDRLRESVIVAYWHKGDFEQAIAMKPVSMHHFFPCAIWRDVILKWASLRKRAILHEYGHSADTRCCMALEWAIFWLRRHDVERAKEKWQEIPAIPSSTFDFEATQQYVAEQIASRLTRSQVL